MNNRERLKAVLNYENYDRMPVVHFGFWAETIDKWYREGHLKVEETPDMWDASPNEVALSSKLGFDFNYYTTFQDKSGFSSLFPAFEPRVVEELSDGMRKVLNEDGALVLEKTGVISIPTEVGHLLVDRESWEEHYLPRLQYSEDRFDMQAIQKVIQESEMRDQPLGIYCKSLFGQIRNWMGVEGVSYLYADDEDLYDEIINTVGELNYTVTKKVLESGAKFDFAHFWEDICFKNGPLVKPSIFDEKVGPYYKKITELVNNYGINIISLDCDGVIDTLIPTWLNNGVNTMFPIEVGTWEASIKPWREKYGRVIRGVGGMNKNVFAEDYTAVDKEIERLKPLIELGGFIPCPDHRIPPTAKWENVQYYCEKMRKIVV
jgi:uroporphyrinogen decarboxylase